MKCYLQDTIKLQFKGQRKNVPNLRKIQQDQSVLQDFNVSNIYKKCKWIKAQIQIIRTYLKLCPSLYYALTGILGD